MRFHIVQITFTDINGDGEVFGAAGVPVNFPVTKVVEVVLEVWVRDSMKSNTPPYHSSKHETAVVNDEWLIDHKEHFSCS